MSDVIEVPGLPDALGVNAGERRSAFRSACRDDMADSIAAWASELRGSEAAMAWIARMARAPYAEVVASPFALRAVALAVEQGAYLVHHDARTPLIWPDESLGGEAVADEMHGVWHRGVLHSGKYQSFLQDEPVCTYNPNHMAKWTPHELLHRVCGFVWRTDLHPWELYLSARLNELVPVVLWYGLDEIARGSGEGFDRARSAARPNITLEECQWLRAGDEDLRALVSKSLRFLDTGLEHLDSELAAIDEEMRTGRSVVVAHEFLNASSDAVAYVVGHRARLRERATARFYERALFPELGIEGSISTYRVKIESVLDRLLFGDIVLNPVKVANRQQIRAQWDVMQRAAQLGWGSFRKMVPLLEAWRADASAAWDSESSADLSEWEAKIADALEEDVRAAVFATGGGVSEHELHQVLEGLESIVPATVVALERDDTLHDWLCRFTESAPFTSRAPLVERLRCWLVDVGRPAFAELARFERDIVSVEDEDPVFEALASGSDIVDRPGLLRANAAFTTYEYGWQVTALHAEPASEPVEVPETLLLGGHEGGVSVLPSPRAVSAVWTRLTAGPASVDDLIEAFDSAPTPSDEFPQSAELWLDELIEAGAIGWVPAFE